MNKIFLLVAPQAPPPPPHKIFQKILAYLVCFGVRFSLYLASWLSDFDLFFFLCVWFLAPLPPPPPWIRALDREGGVPPAQMERKWKSENAQMTQMQNTFSTSKLSKQVLIFLGGGHTERKWWEKNGNQKCLDDF